MSDKPGTTHFGYQEVPITEKVKRVGEVFTSVANRYDLMNDLMSFGVHRLWKRFVIDLAGIRAGERVLDVAGGTGDLTAAFAKQVGPSGQVVLSDINAAMLGQGRARLTDRGVVGVPLVQANAEKLPFADDCFDCITIGFGLRNVTDKDAALRSMTRCLKPGGRLLVLEFSKPLERRARETLRRIFLQDSAHPGPSSLRRMKRPTAISPNPSACIRIRPR